MSNGARPRPVYLDCDTGVDDSLALAYLLNSPEIELVGVGTIGGNTSASQAATNTLNLLSLAGREDVPVALGSPNWLTRKFDGGVPHIHGQNGIGDVQLPTSAGSVISESASELLIRLSHEHAGELLIVAVGPLTNLALALSADPTLAGRIASVTAMGGAVLVPGNVSAVAEANIWNDPEAAQQVVAADWDLTIVPLDVTLENTFEEQDRQQLLDSSDAFTRALGEILDFYFDFYVAFYGRRCSALHDPLAAAIAVGAFKATNAPSVPMKVDTTNGPGRGQTVCDLRAERQGLVDDSGSRNRVVLGLAQPFGSHLVDRLTA